MIDEINAKNGTADFMLSSIFYGGSTQANMPEHLTATTLASVQKEMMAYIRSKNPHVGIYYALGENDLYPSHFLDMTDRRNPLLQAMDLEFNPTADPQTSTTMANQAADRT